MGDSYWTVSFGPAVRMGWTCRECKRAIQKGEQIACRDGRKIRLYYHQGCFSGDADPRTQVSSSFNDPRFPSVAFQSEAPAVKGRGKWSTSAYGYMPSVTKF